MNELDDLDKLTFILDQGARWTRQPQSQVEPEQEAFYKTTGFQMAELSRKLKAEFLPAKYLDLPTDSGFWASGVQILEAYGITPGRL
jgi:hypothetical protein